MISDTLGKTTHFAKIRAFMIAKYVPLALHARGIGHSPMGLLFSLFLALTVFKHVSLIIKLYLQPLQFNNKFLHSYCTVHHFINTHT
jgi:hypothetical protein